MTAIEFTPAEERVLAYYFGAKVRDGKFPLAREAAAAFGTTPNAIRMMLSKLRAKGICVGAPVGLHGPKPEPDDLTDRQREILRWIGDYARREGVSPSLRDIADAFGMGSTNSVMCHVKALIKKGYMRQAGRNKARSYVIAKEVAA